MHTDPAAAKDPLLASLLWLTRHHGRAHSAASLLAGEPVQGKLTAPQALRVLQARGFKAGVVERPLAELDAALLPAVLLLRGRGACIVAQRMQDGLYEVVNPFTGQSHMMAGEKLASRHSGFMLVATPQTSVAAGPPPHWLWGTLRRFMPHYRSALLAALLSNVLMLATGMATSVIYDKVIPHQAFVTLWALAGIAVIAMLFDMVARQLRAHVIDVAGKHSDLLIGSQLFRRALDVRMEHRPASAGACAHQMAQIELVREFTASATLSALSDLPFVLLFTAMIFITAGDLGWVMVGALPLILGSSALMQRLLRRTMQANFAHQTDLHGVLVEAMEGLEDIKATGAQGRFLHRFEQASAAAAETSLGSRRIAALSNNITALAQQLVTLVMLVWGVHLIADGHLTGGALIGAVMYAGRAIAPLSSVVALASRYQGARAALASLDHLMSLPSEQAPPERSSLPLPAASGRIALRDVSFAYPSTNEAPSPAVLRQVNLSFEPGERVAILGRIGSGKSTVLRVLAGLYEPQEGRVELDGVDLRQFDAADFRATLGFVSQEPRLFAGTLRDNVTLGRPGIDAAALAEVAQLTGMQRMVDSHPLGWDLPVGEMGSLLSGGQRQLVALARCLVTRPRIVLMDEPTSSMDAQSEVMFLRQLAAAVADRTLIMVTHRPAVLELVQRVVVIDAGQVRVDGPKAPVLAALSGQPPATPIPIRPAVVQAQAANG
jgi:ATP-binding cassette subfamily C protein LapB